MRTRCTAILPFLLLLGLLDGCSTHHESEELYNESGLRINVVYLCGEVDGKQTRTKMQVKYQSSSDQTITLQTAVRIGDERDEPKDRIVDPRVAGNLEQVEPNVKDVTVYVYRDDKEIATAIFGANDHDCQEGDGKG